jgi:hypothetical protein
MERMANGRQTQEFCEEAVMMATSEGLSVLETAKCVYLSSGRERSTWVIVEGYVQIIRPKAGCDMITGRSNTGFPP